MAHLICDPRDQKYVLYEMLHVEELFKAERFADFSRDTVDMALKEAEKLAAVLQRRGVGVEAGLDVESGIENVRQDLLRLVRGDGLESGADGEAFVAALMAGGAGFLVNEVAFRGIALPREGGTIAGHDFGSGG